MRKRVLVLAAAGLLMAAVLGGCSGGGTDAAAGLSAGGEASSAGTETAAGAGTSSADGETPPDDGDSDSSGEAAISEESGTAAGTEALTGSLTVNGGQEIPLASLEHLTGSEDAPVVYFISDITPESLLEIYGALDWTPAGRVAVKMSTGEPPASNYLRSELIGDLVQSVNGTIVECNTAYGGSRGTTRWQKTTGLPRSPMCRFWMRMAPCPYQWKEAPV